MWRNIMIALLIATVMAASGCGGGSASPTPPTPSAISVQISPVNATVFQGATQPFTATVSGTTNTAVAWSVQEGALGGTITAAGSYRAPVAAGTFHVIATSQADTSKIAIATITVPGPSVAIAPVSVTLAPSGTQAFTATVTGLVNTAVTWTVQEAAGGAVSGAGSYTAPITPGFYHVVATSVADATVSGSATITVTTSAARFTPTGDMVDARGFHTATLLADGKVLVAGGGTRSGPICINGILSAELYDSGTGSFTATGTMTKPRYNHTAILLPNGQVLVIGGLGSTNDCEDLGTPVLSSAELYDPSTHSFKVTGSMTKAREKHTATLLANGKVMVAGGADENGIGSKTAELYDPARGGFTSTGSMATPRSGQTATLLANGRVLIAGGVDTTDPKSPVATATAEIYDSSTGTFTPTNNMTAARAGHTATLLATGRVLIAGGSDLSTAEVYDPATGSFSPTGNMGQARASHTATLLHDGNVLIAGGSDSTAELYEPSTGSFSTTGSMEVGRGRHTATLLLNGKVLVAGGGARPPLATAELYK
jgi:WD40 repeat protein